MAPAAVFPYSHLRDLALISLKKWGEANFIELPLFGADLEVAVDAFLDRATGADGGATFPQLLAHSQELLLTEPERNDDYDILKTMVNLLKEKIDKAGSENAPGENESSDESELQAENRALKTHIADLEDTVSCCLEKLEVAAHGKLPKNKQIESDEEKETGEDSSGDTFEAKPQEAHHPEDDSDDSDYPGKWV